MDKNKRNDTSKCMSNGSKKIWNYVDAGTITAVDYALPDLMSGMMDVGNLAGCTASVTTNESGDVIVGRNQDLSISHYPIYGFYVDTKEPGTYKTFNLAYTFMMGPTVADLKDRSTGLTEEEKTFLPFMALDVLNEKGFYMEANMRDSEFRADGSSVFRNYGTNPDAKLTVYTSNLARYLVDHCATVAEALEAIKEINVKDAIVDNLDWNLCYIMADATGTFGILEVAQDEVIFSEGRNCHGNFYIADKFLNQAKFFDGLGRYTRAMKGIKDVQNLDDMNELMQTIRYSGLFDDNNTEWDNLGDFCMDFQQSMIWLLVHRYDKDVKEKLHGLMHRFDGWSFDEIADDKMKWNTTYRALVNCNTKQMAIVCNEDLEQRVLVEFE